MDVQTKKIRTVPRLLQIPLGIIAGVASVFVLMVFPFAGIRRVSPFATGDWQELAVFAVCFIAAAIGMARVFSAKPELRQRLLRESLQLSSVSNDDMNGKVESVAGLHKTKLSMFTDRYAWIIGLLFLFLYCASIALCMRLHVLGFDWIDSWAQTSLRTLGVVLILVAVALQLKSIFASFSAAQEEVEPTRFSSVYSLRHPILCGWLIFLAGLPIVFGIWMPEAAIPGILVAMNWFVKRREFSLLEQFGDTYKEFCNSTWRIVPIGPRQ